MYDIFKDSGMGVFEGVTQTVGVMPYEFTVKKGMKATCKFVYATIELVVPVVISATVAFDLAGTTAWDVELVRGVGPEALGLACCLCVLCWAAARTCAG